MSKKNKTLLLFLFVFGIVGYVREFFFVHLNIIIYSVYYHSPPSRPIPAIMQVFSRSDYATLYFSKYIYTILFAASFFFLNYMALKKLTSTAYFTKILIYVYAIMFTLAAASMLFGYFYNGTLADEEYTLSRWLMGIAQSPIICLILLASEKLYHKTSSL